MWRKRLPRQHAPTALRVEYFKAIRSLLDRARQLVERELIPQLPLIFAEARVRDRQDAGSKSVNEIMSRVSQGFFDHNLTLQVNGIAEGVARKTAEFQKVQMDRQMKAAFGVDVFRIEPNLGKRVENFVADNVSLITSIPNKYLDEVEKSVTRAVRSGGRPEELAAELEKKYDISEGQARTIARDQIGKFYGEVNKARQENLGIEGYIWRTAQDENVRATHRVREGEKFEWSEPPEGGHPGEDYNCRCYAEPDLSRLVESLDEES